MHITYQAESYSPELVTGCYVRRVIGYKFGYKFRVYETATCWNHGQFHGQEGMGPTLREYLTQGDELPESIKSACKDGSMQKWS